MGRYAGRVDIVLEKLRVEIAMVHSRNAYVPRALTIVLSQEGFKKLQADSGHLAFIFKKKEIPKTLLGYPYRIDKNQQEDFKIEQ
jgi:hypothetical protein